MKRMFEILGMFFFLLDRLRNKSISYYLRYRLEKTNITSNFKIGGNTLLVNCKNIVIGNNSYINGGVIIAGEKSKIIIGENCLISDNVYLRADTHIFSDVEKPIIEQGNIENDIVIGNNVWIGNRVHILSGVTVGDNCIIGAGAVVTKNIPSNSIVGGIPAKIIRKRFC